MKRNGKIIKLSFVYPEIGDSMFLIHRKNIPPLKQKGNNSMKNLSLMQTALMRAVRN